MKPIAPLIALALASAAPAAVAGDAKTANEVFGDWVLHCTKTSKGEEACALHQRIMAADTKLPVAAFALARSKEKQDLRFAAILPLGLDIPAGVAGRAGDLPLTLTIQTCVKRGCIASTMVDDKLLAALHRNATLGVTFHMRSVAEAVTVPVSINGLDAGLKALDGK